MHIRVEKLTLRQTGKPGVHGRDQRTLRITGVTADTFQIGQGHTVEPLHGQDPPGAAVFKHPRYCRIFIMGSVQKLPEHLQVVRFLDEIALFHHGPLDFLDDTGHGGPGQFRCQSFQNTGRQVQEVQIG